jgi:hypothetical protein
MDQILPLFIWISFCILSNSPIAHFGRELSTERELGDNDPLELGCLAELSTGVVECDRVTVAILLNLNILFCFVNFMYKHNESFN